MKNQNGEVATGVMILMMVVMMVFGGMRMMHRDHEGQGGTSDHSHHRRGDHHDKGHQHEHQGDAGKASEQDAEFTGDRN